MLRFSLQSSHRFRDIFVVFVNLVAESHLLLDLGNGLARVETLGAGSRAVKNSVATV